MDSASCMVAATAQRNEANTNDDTNHGSAISVSQNGSDSPSPGRPHAAVTEIINQFALSSAKLEEITDHFLAELQRGLRDASLPFQLPAFVTTIPTGSETGQFLSVDLGGTNCRICLVHLEGNGKYSVTQSKHNVPQDVMVNREHEPLFDWLAARIGDFVKTHMPASANKDRPDTPFSGKAPLGFTFSFTCDQTSLSSGTLIHWDKGWDIPTAIGCDPCRLLQDAMDAAGVLVHVAVLANDSVGTLLARAYTAASLSDSMEGSPSRTLASVIVGTGTNAAYVEQMSRIVRHPQSRHESADQAVMVMNSEWGCLDDALAVLPSTRFDAEIDANSSNPGNQMFEKMASGMYLGELFRLAVLELVQLGGVLQFKVASEDAPLLCRDSLDTALLSSLAEESEFQGSKSSLVSSSLGVQGVSTGDVRNLQAIAVSITQRASRLTGAALAAVLIQCGGITAPGKNNTGKSEEAKVRLTSTALKDDCGAPTSPHTEKRTFRERFVTSVVSCIRGFLSCFLHVSSPSREENAISTQPPCETNKSMSVEAMSADNIPQDVVEIIDIGITGSVIELHPNFERDMLLAMQEIPAIGVDGHRRIRTGLCKDGSAVGAALMAHAALCQHE